MQIKTLSILKNRMFSYRFFKLFPQWKQLDTGLMKDVTKIIETFHNVLIDAVTKERYGVELPLNMGKIMIVSYRARNYHNFSLFKKEGIVSKFLNNHTDGLKCKIFYTNHENKYRLKDKYIWEFKPLFSFKDKVSVAFRNNHNKYIFNPDKQKVFHTGLDYKIKQSVESRVENFLLTYNEFAF